MILIRNLSKFKRTSEARAAVSAGATKKYRYYRFAHNNKDDRRKRNIEGHFSTEGEFH
jgi:hypothetical protein